MGKRGPAPKPTKLKELEGTYRPDRAPDNEAKPDKPDEINKPSWFKIRNFSCDENRDRDIMKYANKFWDKNAKKMAEYGLLTDIDLQSFSMLCVAYGEFVNAIRRLTKYSAVRTAKNGKSLKTNEYAVRKDRAFMQYAKMCKRFGVEPSSRTNIETMVKTEEKPDVEDLLSGTVRNS